MDLESDRFFLCRSCCKLFRGGRAFLEHKKVCSENLAGRSRNSAEACDESLRESYLCGRTEINEAYSLKTTRRVGNLEIAKNELEKTERKLEHSGIMENVEEKPNMETDGADVSDEVFFKEESVRIFAPIVVAAYAESSMTDTKITMEVKIEKSIATVSERSLDDVKPEGATLSVESSSASVISDNDSDSCAEDSRNLTDYEKYSESLVVVKRPRESPRKSKQHKFSDKQFSSVQAKRGHEAIIYSETPELTSDRRTNRGKKSRHSVEGDGTFPVESRECEITGSFSDSVGEENLHVNVKENVAKSSSNKSSDAMTVKSKSRKNSSRDRFGVTFKCSLCPKVYLVEHRFKKHVEDHVNNFSKLKCSLCDQHFTFLQSKRNHERIIHAETPESKDKFKKHQCTVCKKRFLGKQALTYHIRTHTGEKPYACRFCPKKFASTQQRRLHEKCMHGTDPTFRESFKEVCAICSKKFMSSYLLDLHMRSHTGRKPFSCDFCPKTFSQRAHKKAHALCMHPDEEHLDENGQKLHFHQCSHCPKKFYSKPDFERHLLIHSGEMPFKCRFCPAKFNLAGNQNRHEIDVHNDKLDPEKMAGKHKCGWCSRIFHSKSELKGHETTHSGSRDFKCDHCPRSYTSKNSLNLHLRINHQDLTHLKLTPLPPSRLKGKTGNGNARLLDDAVGDRNEDSGNFENKHASDQVSDQKYYKCSTCSKEFNSKSILERHELRGHSEKVMFPCRFCSREFTGNPGRFYHELKIHQEEMDPQEIAYKPKCRWCNKRFVNQAYLANHEKTHAKTISGKAKRLAPDQANM